MSVGVVYRKDGKYLIYRERYTRTGYKRDFLWVDEIGAATIFYRLPSPWNRKELEGAEKVWVKETRQVVVVESPHL